MLTRLPRRLSRAPFSRRRELSSIEDLALALETSRTLGPHCFRVVRRALLAELGRLLDAARAGRSS
jgi:hypothetical protein